MSGLYFFRRLTFRMVSFLAKSIPGRLLGEPCVSTLTAMRLRREKNVLTVFAWYCCKKVFCAKMSCRVLVVFSVARLRVPRRWTWTTFVAKVWTRTKTKHREWRNGMWKQCLSPCWTGYVNPQFLFFLKPFLVPKGSVRKVWVRFQIWALSHLCHSCSPPNLIWNLYFARRHLSWGCGMSDNLLTFVFCHTGLRLEFSKTFENEKVPANVESQQATRTALVLLDDQLARHAPLLPLRKVKIFPTLKFILDY